MRRAALALAILALAGCATTRAEPLTLGPFQGVLPCADCPGIRTELTLTRKGEGRAEGTYRLSETYIDRGAAIVTMGEWTTHRRDAADEDAVVYELNPDKPEAVRYFRKLSAGEIQALDRELKDWPASLPSRLKVD